MPPCQKPYHLTETKGLDPNLAAVILQLLHQGLHFLKVDSFGGAWLLERQSKLDLFKVCGGTGLRCRQTLLCSLRCRVIELFVGRQPRHVYETPFGPELSISVRMVFVSQLFKLHQVLKGFQPRVVRIDLDIDRQELRRLRLSSKCTGQTRDESVFWMFTCCQASSCHPQGGARREYLLLHAIPLFVGDIGEQWLVNLDQEYCPFAF